ncbi:hypothetical protein EB796_020383 [Bugula neritina]|uniref:Uncharacterized protein n=1 Tax=Bugula neritina TaxID=10212 RepID=A0A7J7J536_BUGNE|nr:hypothetical protein EB796_020383 [Bugula neritina]
MMPRKDLRLSLLMRILAKEEYHPLLSNRMNTSSTSPLDQLSPGPSQMAGPPLLGLTPHYFMPSSYPEQYVI